MAAQTNASAIPVLPLVASTIVVRPGSIRPSRSAASIIATPIRSLTLPPGLNASSLANSSTSLSPAILASCTIGVRPTRSAMLIGILGIDSESTQGQAGMPPVAGGHRRVDPGARRLEAGGPETFRKRAVNGAPCILPISSHRGLRK